MNCAACGAENRLGRKFCRDCGQPLDVLCPSCGAHNDPDDKFCGECGKLLADPGATGTEAPRFASPEAYTPPHLAEKIITSRGALEGERKQVTVLFADLKASTELIANRDPEEARAILDPVVERMMEAVHRYEGTVNQVAGDGIMALFGAPIAHEDHAVRACYAALAMQESIKAYAAEVLRNRGVPIQIRVGLNSGEVVVGSISSDLSMDYTAIGQTTHLAARMEQMATPGSILIAPETLRLVEGYVHVNSLGPLPVRGLSEPVEVCEVLAATALRTRLQAAAARGFTQFVGRDAEIEVLRGTLERAAGGHGQVVAVAGDPGVGKSRLVWEFAHSHRTQGWLVLETSSVSYGKATPYLPVVDLLKAYFGIEARDEGRTVRQKVLGKVLELDEALRPVVPALLALLEAPVDDAAWIAMDPPQRRRETLAGIKALLLRESRIQPMMVIAEDLHWVDSETQAVLDSLVESLGSARFLLLVNYRLEYQQLWGSKTFFREIRLDPLPPESADQLLDSLLGEDPSLAPLKGQLIAQTEGNPFFLEESVRTLVETGGLSGERGAYALGRPLAALQVPQTVQAVLAARIDRLPVEEKRLLQCAAVIGKDVPFDLLRAISEEPEGQLRQRLAHLHAAEFLYEIQLFPDLEYTFKHALTHEVAYGSVLQERRRTLHAQIVAAIEGLHADRLAEHTERLAYHALRGEAWDKAVEYARDAGTRAVQRSMYQEAAANFDQALEALDHLEESRRKLEYAVDLRVDLRNALYPLVELDRVWQLLEEAQSLAERLGDPRRLGWVSVYLSNLYWGAGDYERSVEAGRRALAIAEHVGELALEAEATYRLGQAHYTVGRYPEAASILQRTIEQVGPERARERFGLTGFPAVMARHWLVECLAEMGRFEEAIAHVAEGLRLGEEIGHPFSLAGMLLHAGMVQALRGDLAEGDRFFQRGLDLARDRQLPLFVAAGSLYLGFGHVRSGRDAEAIALLEGVLPQLGAFRAAFGSQVYSALGEAYLHLGRAEEAQVTGDQALEIAREMGQRGLEAWALRVLAEIAAASEPPELETAEARYGEALALAEELSMRLLAAHCHLGLGSLYGKASRRERARPELATASELFRSMGMPTWLAQAEAEAAKLGDQY